MSFSSMLHHTLSEQYAIVVGALLHNLSLYKVELWTIKMTLHGTKQNKMLDSKIEFQVPRLNLWSAITTNKNNPQISVSYKNWEIGMTRNQTVVFLFTTINDIYPLN